MLCSRRERVTVEFLGPYEWNISAKVKGLPSNLPGPLKLGVGAMGLLFFFRKTTDEQKIRKALDSDWSKVTTNMTKKKDVGTCINSEIIKKHLTIHTLNIQLPKLSKNN